jgi:hypothetical protein
MPCTVCGRVYCDCTPEERGQTPGGSPLQELDADGQGGWDRVERVNKERGVQTITHVNPTAK